MNRSRPKFVSGTSVKEYLDLWLRSAKTRRRRFPRYPEFENKDIWIETYIRPCNFLNNIENI